MKISELISILEKFDKEKEIYLRQTSVSNTGLLGIPHMENIYFHLEISKRPNDEVLGVVFIQSTTSPLYA